MEIEYKRKKNNQFQVRMKEWKTEREVKKKIISDRRIRTKEENK